MYIHFTGHCVKKTDNVVFFQALAQIYPHFHTLRTHKPPQQVRPSTRLPTTPELKFSSGRAKPAVASTVGASSMAEKWNKNSSGRGAPTRRGGKGTKIDGKFTWISHLSISFPSFFRFLSGFTNLGIGVPDGRGFKYRCTTVSVQKEQWNRIRGDFRNISWGAMLPFLP